MKSIVLYHANCADGFTAAWVAHRALGDDAEYVPCQYGDSVYEPQEDCDCYLLDFSYKAEGMETLRSRVSGKLVVLDHHETALKELAAWLNYPADPELRWISFGEPSGRTTCRFDMDQCGATLAWEWWLPQLEVPRLLKYVRDRDLWIKDLKHTEEVSAWISTVEKSFWKWSQLYAQLDTDSGLRHVVERGRGALALKEAKVREAVGHAVPLRLGDHEGLAVNASAFFSEIAGELAEQSGTFGAVFFRTEEGRWAFSLRSRGDLKVNEIAAQFGGGGHPRAAGFRVDSLKKVGLGD